MTSKIMDTAIRRAQREMSPEDIVQSINALLGILDQRDVRIKDFDNKNRTLYSIKIYGKKAYLLFSQGKKEANHDESERRKSGAAALLEQVQEGKEA